MVSVEVAGGRLLVRAPYNPDFPDRAKPLGGKWAPAEKAWAFDPRDEAVVRGICRATYGTDGSVLVPADLCTIRVTLTGTGAAVFLGGREIACASGRDGRAGRGVHRGTPRKRRLGQELDHGGS